ncbi:MAG: hypothetical protein MK180_04715 [Rhodobacteraceae bacterium]|nr:hypothetical protein [Paracoccaceae bacterium]
MTYDDATLQSYLAGDLPEAEASALEASLAESPELEALLRALDEVGGDVAQAFAAVTPPAKPHMPERAQSVGVASLAACVGLALAVGVGVGWWLAQPDAAPAPWVVAVADYQVLYQPVTVASLSHDPAVIAEQLARSGDVLETDLSGLGDLLLEDQPLLRAQVLGLGDRPIIQMVFQLEDGTPAALCLTRAGSGAVEQMGVISGLASSRWQEQGLDVLLIADVDESRLQSLAVDARHALAAL